MKLVKKDVEGTGIDDKRRCPYNQKLTKLHKPRTSNRGIPQFAYHLNTTLCTGHYTVHVTLMRVNLEAGALAIDAFVSIDKPGESMQANNLLSVNAENSGLL